MDNIRGGFFIVSNVLDVRVQLPVEITPKLRLAKADDAQISAIQSWLTAMSPGFVNPRSYYEKHWTTTVHSKTSSSTSPSPLERKDWRYYILSFAGYGNDGVALFPVALKYEAGTLLASASSDTGLVYVFERADGRFFRRATLRARDARPGDGFGSSLSMTKTTLVMGSSGAAYVFIRNGLGNWVQTQKLVPAGTADGFGSSVAIDQGMIIVGASSEDLETEFDTPDGHWAGGAAYVFLPTAGRYLESLRLRPRVDEKFEYVDFGRQVAMFGRYIAIQAEGRPTFQSVATEGIAFTYTRDGSSVLARGIASTHFQSNSGNISMALANNWLLVGHLGSNRCFNGCPGDATLYDVNRFRQ